MVVNGDAKIADAVRVIDSNGIQLAMIVDAGGHLVGIVTDGDIRRAMLAGKDLSQPISSAMNRNPKTATAPIPKHAALAQMEALDITHLPVVDEEGRLVGLELRRPASTPLEGVWAVVMAGGLGKRLAPLTDNVPKPLLPVGGRPMIELIIRSLVLHGISRIFLSINYRGDMIRAFCGDGSNWGAEISYLEEDEPRGTAGGLALLPRPLPQQVLVMNGDILTNIDYFSLIDFHRRHGGAATMCIREQRVPIDYGVVHFDGPFVADIVEKPYYSCFINAGIYVLSPPAFRHISPTGEFSMPTLFKSLIAEGQQSGAFPLREFWIDIGSHADYKRAQHQVGSLEFMTAGRRDRGPRLVLTAR